MCQLCFISVDSGWEELIPLQYLVVQAHFNSYKNQDGLGIFIPNGKDGTLWKTELTPERITNLHIIFNKLINEGATQVMMHLRAASTKNKAKLSMEHSHPFNGDRFVLQHNGTLHTSVKKYADLEASGMIDSQIFHQNLEDAAKENPDKTLSELVEQIMKDYEGKFAFMIYDKVEKKWYIIRGKSATLYLLEIKTKGKLIGFIVNTEKDSLFSGFNLARNIINLSLDREWYLDYVEEKDITALEAETVYEVNTELQELEAVGKVKENERQGQVYFSSGYSYEEGEWSHTRSFLPAESGRKQTSGERAAGYIAKMMGRFKFSLSFADKVIAFFLNNGGILGLTEKESANLEESGIIETLDSITDWKYWILIIQSFDLKYTDDIEMLLGETELPKRPFFMNDHFAVYNELEKVLEKKEVVK